MFKTKRLLAMLLVVISLMVFTVVPASTAPIQSALDLGFTLDSSVYTATWYSSTNVINVYNGSHYLGSAYQKVGVAVQKANTKRKTVLIRLQLDPEDTKYSGTFYHGINKTGRMTMTLGTGQSYVNYAPDSSAVTYNDTFSFSLGGTVNSKGEFGGTIGIGASTTTTNSGFTVISKITNSQKTYTTTYNYSPSWNIVSTTARKNQNKWLNSSHKEYAMYQFDTPNASMPSFTITYNVGMWYSTSSSSTWNGSTWDVWPTESITTKTVKYNGF